MTDQQSQRRSYKQYREENRFLTAHDLSLDMMLDLETISVNSPDELDSLSSKYLSRLIAERRILGSQWLNFFMQQVLGDFGLTGGQNYELKQFYKEGDFIDYLIGDLTNCGKKLRLGSKSRRFIEDLLREFKTGKASEKSKLLDGIERLRKIPIISAGYFNPNISFTQPTLIGIYGGQKTSASANKKQACLLANGLEKIIRLMVQERRSTPPQEIREVLIMEDTTPDIEVIEDLFRLEMIYGGTVGKLEPIIKGMVKYIHDHPLFELIGPPENYLSGLKTEQNGEIRKRNRELHIKFRINSKVGRTNELRKLYVPDAFELHITTVKDLVVSEFAPDVGRVAYVETKDKVQGQNPTKNPYFNQAIQNLSRLSPTPDNPLLPNNFWIPILGKKFGRLSSGHTHFLDRIRKDLITPNQEIWAAYGLMLGKYSC